MKIILVLHELAVHAKQGRTAQPHTLSIRHMELVSNFVVLWGKEHPSPTWAASATASLLPAQCAHRATKPWEKTWRSALATVCLVFVSHIGPYKEKTSSICGQKLQQRLSSPLAQPDWHHCVTKNTYLTSRYQDMPKPHNTGEEGRSWIQESWNCTLRKQSITGNVVILFLLFFITISLS